MRMSKKLLAIVLALLMAMSIALVACDDDIVLTEEEVKELYNSIIEGSVAKDGYTLTSDIYLIEDTEKTNKVGYYHKTVVVDEARSATITTVEAKLPEAGKPLTPVAREDKVANYVGESIAIDFNVNNLVEGFTITQQGSRITIIGSPIDVDVLMDREMGEVSNMKISITINTELKVIESYTITYDGVTTSTVETYTINAVVV